MPCIAIVLTLHNSYDYNNKLWIRTNHLLVYISLFWLVYAFNILCVGQVCSLFFQLIIKLGRTLYHLYSFGCLFFILFLFFYTCTHDICILFVSASLYIKNGTSTPTELFCIIRFFMFTPRNKTDKQVLFMFIYF